MTPRHDEVSITPPAGFRDDINGLRAIAVAAVVIYHFHAGVLNGGYLGVDIFFVISGFLMTKVILGRLEKDRFGLWAFYIARVRRIVPALLVMCAVVCVLAIVVVDPLAAALMGKDAAASLTFWSNMLYAGQGGYFARAQESTG